MRLFHLFFFILFISCSLQADPLDIAISAKTAILINSETGRVLFEKNADEKIYPASTTKVATALYGLNIGTDRLEELTTAKQEAVGSISSAKKRNSGYAFPPHWIEQGGTHMGIKRGEKLKLIDLFYGLMLPSANDAANVIAQHLTGSIPEFMTQLNRYLKSIGCTNTSFNNPHGLHHPDHTTSARDLALIGREAMKLDLFREIVASERYLRPQTNKQQATMMGQLNKLVRRASKHYYQPALGIKTGYTSEAGHCLVAAAKDEGRYLIAVVTGCDDREHRFKDTTALFEAAFREKKLRKEILPQGSQSLSLTVEGADGQLKTYLKEPIAIEYFPSEEPSLKAAIHWKELTLPVQKEELVAEVEVISSDPPMHLIVPLFAEEELQASLFFSLTENFTQNWHWLLAALGSFTLFAAFILSRR